MKRRFGIAVFAALSTMAISQPVLADSYDFWTANTPKRAERQAASPRIAPVESAAESQPVYDFWNALTPTRAGSRAASPRIAPVRSTVESTPGFDFWNAHTPKRAATAQAIPAAQAS